MDKKGKQILSFVLIGIFLFSIFIYSLNFVIAQANPQKLNDPLSGFNPDSVSSTSPEGFLNSVVLLVNQVINLFTQAGSPLFSTLLGDVGGSGDLFTKVLIFFLVIIVTVAVLDNIEFFSGRIWLQVGVGSIISILGIRFM